METTPTTETTETIDRNAPFTQRVMTDEFVERFKTALATDRGEKPADPAPAATPPASAPDTKPATDAPAEEPVPEPVAKSPKAAAEWKNLKAKHKAEIESLQKRLETEKAELESKLKAAPAGGEVSEQIKRELEELKRERDEYSEQLRLLDVERHPKFRAYYENAINTQIEKAKAIVGPEKAAEVAELLAMPESAWKAQRVNELIADLTPYQQTRLGATLDKLADITLEREAELRKSRENWDKVNAQREAEVKAEQEKFAKTFDDVVRGLGPEWEPFKAKEGDDAWNAAVKERIESARAIYSGQLPPAEMAVMALKASAIPLLLQSFQATAQRAKALEEEVAALKAASPKPAGGETSPAPATEEEGADYRSGLERRASALFGR